MIGQKLGTKALETKPERKALDSFLTMYRSRNGMSSAEFRGNCDEKSRYLIGNDVVSETAFGENVDLLKKLRV